MIKHPDPGLGNKTLQTVFLFNLIQKNMQAIIAIHVSADFEWAAFRGLLVYCILY